MTGAGATSRWNRLRLIHKIHHGPGAALLPPSITRIHMEFARKSADGHMGSRKFWREHLPRLKYHNPAIPMIVNRKDNNEGAATMTIYFRNAATAAGETVNRIQPPSSAMDTSKAVAPAADERVVKIDMKNKHSDDILRQFMAETQAKPVEHTPEQLQEIEAVEEFIVQAEKDRTVVQNYRDEVKKEQDMLRKARESASTT
ncbi:50S ribosomal protein Mrp49 [Plectosphaerella plurivora]|uniref:50S ribosomal protein Mrp49 n=1 Tax=Plectosphaerella plurivora TaxID=936078 RepID=A0A9P8V2X3_9PEZI|nr:50S ribosomal protein Mrp49 [Plectosphaerella plurivora]